MGKGKNAYVVCAKLQGADTPCSEQGEVMAGQPAIRRLNRMERVALSFDGELARRANAGLLMSFETASEAVLAACEMQRRCAGLPQLSGNRLTLKIGIHKAAPQTCFTTLQPVSASGPRAERRDHKRRSGFDTAGRLAGFASEDSVIVSTLVFEALDPEIRKIGQPLRDESTNVPVHALNWHSVLAHPMKPLPSAPSAQPASPRLILRFGAKRLELDRLSSVTTIGRDPGCDITISDRFASRIHALIEIRPEGCVLTDQSANGTSVILKSGMEVMLKDESFLLTGRGHLAFGRSAAHAGSDTFEFQVLDS